MRATRVLFAACAVALLLLLSGAGHSTPAITTPGGGGPNAAAPQLAGSVARPSRVFRRGQWTAVGTIRVAPEKADALPEEQIVRPWWFVRRCDRGCHTEFLRETEYGSDETPVIAGPHGTALAHVPPSLVPCEHPQGVDNGDAEFSSTFRFSWSADHQTIRAHERSTYRSVRCPSRPETISWVARRTDPLRAPPAPGF